MGVDAAVHARRRGARGRQSGLGADSVGIAQRRAHEPRDAGVREPAERDAQVRQALRSEPERGGNETGAARACVSRGGQPPGGQAGIGQPRGRGSARRRSVRSGSDQRRLARGAAAGRVAARRHFARRRPRRGQRRAHRPVGRRRRDAVNAYLAGLACADASAAQGLAEQALHSPSRDGPGLARALLDAAARAECAGVQSLPPTLKGELEQSARQAKR